MTIWKYPLDPNANYLDIPEGAEFLTLQMQNETPCLWFRVDPSNKKKRIFLYIVGTGWEVQPELHYLGTYQFVRDGLVFHVFSPEKL